MESITFQIQILNNNQFFLIFFLPKDLTIFKEAEEAWHSSKTENVYSVVSICGCGICFCPILLSPNLA